MQPLEIVHSNILKAIGKCLYYDNSKKKKDTKWNINFLFCEAIGAYMYVYTYSYKYRDTEREWLRGEGKKKRE